MNLQRSTVIRQLRPPFTQPTKVIYGYSKNAPVNLGLTCQVDPEQPVVAAGDGVVDLIAPLRGQWRTDLPTVGTVVVRIDHGMGIKTLVHGLGNVTATYGPVTRGQLLGYPAQTQLFFTLEYNGTFTDPTKVNQHFGLMSGSICYQKQGNLRQAPDLLTTAVTLVESLWWKGVHYFIPPTPVPALFDLDFNGQGKTGAAVVGITGGDVWNAVTPIDFSPIGPIGYAGYCVGGLLFPAPQGFFLVDSGGNGTKVYFERGVLTAASGVTPTFDPMLSTWVGGVGLRNGFTIRNLPPGTYVVYVYVGGPVGNTTAVYFSLNGDLPLYSPTITTVADSTWVEDENYVKAVVTLAVGSQLTILVNGFLSGVQILRTSV